MRLVRHLEDLPYPKLDVGSVVTIGAYDGLHLGHQQLLARVLKVAKERNLHAVVMSFEPTPKEFFGGERPPARNQNSSDIIKSEKNKEGKMNLKKDIIDKTKGKEKIWYSTSDEAEKHETLKLEEGEKEKTKDFEPGMQQYIIEKKEIENLCWIIFLFKIKFENFLIKRRI